MERPPPRRPLRLLRSCRSDALKALPLSAARTLRTMDILRHLLPLTMILISKYLNTKKDILSVENNG